ncbi:chorismate--pyruvate lyase family protein [Vibrio viridaestus]|uniref:Probable chorismate pyruvate-lyase n=1 Tax=Vibrio viridaestus TaxID=2487322 RepID=A0A3N9TDB9_9VIBR|nr:chorismate lyase [Vibrio viridaestus]RQW61515.1 chorismate lyase [Vibrio viridaestus]
MNRTFSLNLSIIKQTHWLDPSLFLFTSDIAQQWLTEQGSLSELIKSRCGTFSVDLLESRWVEKDTLQPDEQNLLPSHDQYLIRQVILNADGKPWVYGYSIIPKSTAVSASRDLSSIGQLPLGEAIFRAEKVGRDELKVSEIIDTENKKLLVRRSRLWMEDNPLLVTELFLSDAPIYS